MGKRTKKQAIEIQKKSIITFLSRKSSNRYHLEKNYKINNSPLFVSALTQLESEGKILRTIVVARRKHFWISLPPSDGYMSF